MRSLILALALLSSAALAYPTSAVYAPTGDVRAGGDVGVFLYHGLFLAPGVGPGPSWLGIQVGVLPRIPYGNSGLSFGGLEVGIDAFAGDLAGTVNAYEKPVLNAKLGLVTEGTYVPNVGVGLMQVAPTRWNRSLNIVYGALTKTIQVGATSYGRVTLGMGGSLLFDATDPDRETFPAFVETAPFPRGSRLMLIAGYESPAFGPFSFAIDHLGGSSEVGSTNIALNFTPLEGATLGIGTFLGSDPQAFYAGLFAYLYLNFNVLKVFEPKA